MTDGAVDVLAVCAALGYLGAGDAGAGMLQAIIGAGTVAGGMLLVASRRTHGSSAGVVAGSVVRAWRLCGAERQPLASPPCSAWPSTGLGAQHGTVSGAS